MRPSKRVLIIRSFIGVKEILAWKFPALYIYKPRQRDPNGEQEDTGVGTRTPLSCTLVPDHFGSTEDAKSAADSSKLAVKKPRPKASSPNRQGPQQCQVSFSVRLIELFS
uniref:Uncharacterized protein n=1 Tax=Timema monikensis TaxID=170555 RepID=A0A7R9E418_9NEOP|nr:unnamed protein product [Timema monikensis]